MGIVRDIFIEEHERLTEELVQRGVPYDIAYDLTADQAYGAMRERLADMGDMAKKRGSGE